VTSQKESIWSVESVRGLISSRSLTQPCTFKVVVWLVMFLSPTGYILFLMMVDRLRVPALPEGLVVALFCAVPVVALLVCGRMVWLSKMSVSWRVGWLVFTVLAMLLQVSVWFVIIVAVISAVIAPAQ
jgi:hypothetical protein